MKRTSEVRNFILQTRENLRLCITTTETHSAEPYSTRWELNHEIVYILSETSRYTMLTYLSCLKMNISSNIPYHVPVNVKSYV
jgi:hypothetical protein